MPQATIGSLRINLGIDSAQFSKGLKGADSGLKRFGANVAKSMAAVGAAVSAAVAGIAIGVRGAINEADKLGKMAQQIGIPVAELSRLKHAAELSGSSLEGLSTSMGRLSRNMSDVAQGAGAEARRAFEQLGITVTNTDGTLKSSTAVMAEMADRFAGMEDGAGKTALAMQLMGRSGAQMIPMLNAGADGLNRMMQEADALGIVITEKTARAAAAFNDNLDNLRKIMTGIWTQMAEHLLPHLQRLSEQLVAAANNSDLMKNMSSNLATALKWVADVAIRATAGIRGMRAELAGLAEGLSLLGDLEFKAARDAWNAGQQEFQRIQQGMQKTLHDLWSNKGDRLDATAIGTQIAEPMAVAAEQVKESGRQISQSVGQVQTNFQSIDTGAMQLGSTLQGAFSGVFDSVVNGTFKAKDAIASLLKDLGRLLANRVFMTLLDNLGGNLFGGAGGPKNIIPGFATGGTILPGGAGGIDSQLVTFYKSPNEQVDIYKPGQDRGGGPLNVRVEVENTGQPVQARETGRRFNGRELVVGIMLEAIARGEADGAMQGRYGARPVVAGRSGG